MATEPVPAPSNLPPGMSGIMGEVMRHLDRAMPGSVRAWQPGATTESAEHSPNHLIALHLKLTPKDHPPCPPGKFFGYSDGRWSFGTAQGMTVCYLVPRTTEEERGLDAHRQHIANLAYAIWRFEYGCEHLADLWPAWGRKKTAQQARIKVGIEFRRYGRSTDWNLNIYTLKPDGTWTSKPTPPTVEELQSGQDQKLAVVSLPVPGVFLEQDITDQMEFSEISAPLPIPAPK